MYLDPKDPGTTVKKKHPQHFAVKLQNALMVDKLSTLPRAKIGETFGRIEDEKMRAVDRAMLLVIGVI